LIGFWLVIPEADQQITCQPDAFPAEKQLYQIIRRRQHQHGEGEERQVGKEPRFVRILFHVADRIDVDERGDRRDYDQHHGGQPIDAEYPFRVQIAERDECKQRHARFMPGKADVEQRKPRQHTGNDEKRRRGQLGQERSCG
jgi:hypothetical protein